MNEPEEYRLSADVKHWANLIVIGAAFAIVTLGTEALGSASFLWLALASIAPALLLFLQPTKVRLGREAMERRRLFFRRQLRYDDVVDVTYVDGTPPNPTFFNSRDPGVRARLTVRARRRGWTFRGETDRDGDLRELGNAIERRLRVYRRASHEELPALARGARDVARWTQDLRALVAGDTDADAYRRAPTPPDTLLRIAENPTSPDADRVAALVALSPARTTDAAVATRIAALAADTAAPHVRVALDAWLAEDDEALDRSLEKVATK